jgi:predicted amidohydrolase YtcJ
VAVGSDAEIERYVGRQTEVIELRGRLMLPGLIEGHGHFMGLGEQKLNLELANVKNWDEIVAMVGAAARDAAPGAWIVGRGWHQEKWNRVPEPNVEGVPLHASLDAVSPNNPVFLRHASGHAAFANRRALDQGGVDRNTPNPEGGEIVKDASGEPTGLLRETAQRLVNAAYSRAQAARPEQEKLAERRRIVELASAEALSKGITSFQDAGSSFELVDFFKQLETENALPMRLYVMIRESNQALEGTLPRYLMTAGENDYLTVRALKVTIDGALGSHGAWLLEKYDDMPAGHPSSHGMATVDPKSVERTAELAIQHGFQLNVHAIGDRANREVLDIYERTFKRFPDRKDVRWRIEHAQHLHPADIPRFGALGVIASMQGVHATSDGPWIVKRLGEQRAREGAYVWRELIKTGAVIANGTDTPVEDVSPIASFYASVSRRMNNGQVFYGEQRMTRDEALRSYTRNNAYAAFEERHKGSLTAGKLADIVVLSKDIMRIPENEIPTASVDLTIVGGQVRYRRPEQVTRR